jgi:RNA polymerase sigma factor (TIGR02999 family)
MVVSIGPAAFADWLSIMEDPHSQITRLLQTLAPNDPSGRDLLLPLVYDELRELARAKVAREPVGLTLDPTALVHEAYLRLAGETDASWKNRAHFFSAAAEAMRRILIERARHKQRLKHGGGRRRLDLADIDIAREDESLDLIRVDEALTRLNSLDARLANVVSLRFFAGLSVERVADLLDIAPRTVKRDWEFARAWLYAELKAADTEMQA